MVSDRTLDVGRLQARCSILMQALAALSRRNAGESEWIRQRVKAADEAAANVRREDMVVALPVDHVLSKL